MTTNQPMISTPALILTIGPSLVSAVADIKRIFFQSDSRRQATTCFLGLSFHAKKPELIHVGDMESEKRPGNLSHNQILEISRENIETIKAGIRASLHELRSHEKLMEVGLGGKTALPLDVIIVADLAEPETVSLEEILPLFQTLLEDEPYAKVHILLSAAVFSEDPLPAANVHIALETIQKILEEEKQSSVPHVYLFDRYKEGVWEACDASELKIVLGNFLLALLSGGLAQHLAHRVSQMDMEERRAYFCGASATALILDVEQLQKACAMRLGAEIIEAEFQSKIVPDPVPVEEQAADFERNHANRGIWMNRLCRETIFRAHPDGLGVELHFSDLRFEDVPMEDWVKSIQAYDIAFKEKRLPVQESLAARNADELNQEFLDQLAAFVQLLPQQARLYPGGVRSSQAILERLRKNMQLEQSVTDDFSAIEQDWNAQISESLDKLSGMMQTLPKPPRWVFRLPPILKKPATQLFNMIFLYRELKVLTELRQNSVRLMEQKYEAWMKVVLTKRLMDLHAVWLVALEKHIKAINRLQSALDRLLHQFKEQTVELINVPSLFRLSALDEPVLAWAYYYGKRPQDGFRYTLLTECSFLNDWQKSNIKVFEKRLKDFCEQIYQPLAGTDLEEALHHRNGKDASVLAVSLMQGAVPMLRPNFDQTGSGSSFQLRFFQGREPLSSSLYPVFKSDEQEWEVISTDDQLIAICSRVRMMIPFHALNHIFDRGRAEVNTVGGEEKQR